MITTIAIVPLPRYRRLLLPDVCGGRVPTLTQTESGRWVVPSSRREGRAIALAYHQTKLAIATNALADELDLTIDERRFPVPLIHRWRLPPPPHDLEPSMLWCYLLAMVSLDKEHGIAAIAFMIDDAGREVSSFRAGGA